MPKKKQKTVGKNATGKPNKTGSPEYSIIKSRWLPSLVVVLLGLIAMGPIIGNQFINFDDPELIYNNPIVTGSESGLRDFFSKFLFTPFYKPLVFLFWNIEYRMAGPNPSVFHTINLLLHLINSILVFYIFRSICQIKNPGKELGLYIGLFIAGLFAAHPLHVESVAWAVERKDVLYGFFFLGSALAYLVARRKTGNQILLLSVSLVLFIAALLSKSPAIVLPAVLFIVDYYLDNKWTKKSMLRLVPYVVITMIGFYAYGLFGNFNQYTLGITEGITATQNEIFPSNLIDLPAVYRRIVLINTRFWLFVFHLILPVKLSLIYPRYDIIQSLGVLVHIFPMLTLALAYISIKWRKSKPELLFGATLFAICMLPVLALSGAGTNFLSDRYTYISSLGLFFIPAFYLLHPNRRRQKVNPQLLFGGMMSILVLLSIASHNRSNTWYNSESIWSDVIQKYPEKVWDAYNGRGLFYKNEGRQTEALADLQQAVAIQPNPTTYVNRALIYQELGQAQKAMSDFNEAIQLKPNFATAYINRGGLHFNAKQYQEALRDLNRAIELNDQNAMVYLNRGLIYAAMGNSQSALTDLNNAAQLDPYLLPIYKNRALLYYNLQDYQRARADCATSISLNENAHYAYHMMGLIHMARKEYRAALPLLDKAVSLHPNNGEYLLNRARCRELTQDYGGALNDLNMLRQLGFQVDPEMYQRLSKTMN